MSGEPLVVVFTLGWGLGLRTGYRFAVRRNGYDMIRAGKFRLLSGRFK